MKTIVLFLLGCLWVGFSYAQIGMTTDLSNAMAWTALNGELNRITIATGTPGNNNPGKNIRTTAAANPKLFWFIPNTETSKKVKQAIIDNEKKKHPNTRLEEALNDKNNPYPNYVKLLKSLGLDVQYNYADAFTAYMIGMWRIANKMNNNPTIEQIKLVRNQIAATLDIGKLSNVQKQEYAEYIIYDLIFANEPYEGSRKSYNQKQTQEDSDAVYYRFLKQNKLDFRKMEITDKGLVTTK